MANRQTWQHRLIAACLLSFVLWLGVFNTTKARILVVHSSSASTPWVQAVDAGMQQALANNRRPVSVSWMYLGLQSPANQRQRYQSRAALQRMLDQIDPDVVIAVDDEANALIAQTAASSKRTRILYVSVDRSPHTYRFGGDAQVSGISETLPLAAIRDAATTLFAGRELTAAVIGIDTPTGQAEMAQVRDFDWGPINIKATRLVATAAAWRTFVNSTPADLLLVLSTHGLPEPSGTITPANALIRWTQEHAQALPIGTQIDFVPSGGALSFAPPPLVYGQEAITAALDWLDQRRSPGPPPAQINAHFQVGLRQSALAARGLRLPPIYSEAARAAGALYP
jgi:hypothetical protein